MRPERQSPPEANQGAQSVCSDNPSVSRPSDRFTHLIGCPCGCLLGVDCAAERPAVDRDGHCCGALGFSELRAAARLGLNCARGCVRVRLAGAA